MWLTASNSHLSTSLQGGFPPMFVNVIDDLWTTNLLIPRLSLILRCFLHRSPFVSTPKIFNIWLLKQLLGIFFRIIVPLSICLHFSNFLKAECFRFQSLDHFLLPYYNQLLIWSVNFFPKIFISAYLLCKIMFS